MPDNGPLNPNHQVAIAYPDLPPDSGNKLNTLITAIEQTHSHFNAASGRVQGVMSQANGAVTNVAGISQGKGAQALVQTWFYSLSDGHQAQNGMSDAATHLNASLSALYENVPVIQNNMSTLNMVRNNGGTVASMDADGVQSQMNDLTNALGNIGMALQAASTLINGMNNSWPRACATGFIPGSSAQPTFAPHVFDNTMHMSGSGGAGGLASDAGKAILNKLGNQDEAELLSLIAEEKGANLNDVAALVEKGMNPDTIVQWLENGKSIDGVGNLLNKGVSTDQLSQWMDQGLSPSGIETMLNKGYTVDMINKGLTSADASRWGSMSNRLKNNIADALKNWKNGTQSFVNDSTEFQNNGNVLPANNGPYTEYTVSSSGVKGLQVGEGSGLRIVVDKYGNVYYTADHYKKGSFIQVPWNFVINALGQ